MASKMLKVGILEGRQLQNLSGKVRCEATLSQNYPFKENTQKSKLVDENFNNPVWSDANFEW
jgi:hypothetical protein